MMQVRKAVITAAAPNQNRLPLQQLVDCDGNDKTALQLIVEEIVAAGVEEICVVIQPGDHFRHIVYSRVPFQCKSNLHLHT